MGSSIGEEYKEFVKKVWRFFVRKEPATVFHRECAHEVSSKACINSGPNVSSLRGSLQSPESGNQLTAEHRVGSWLVADKGRKFLQQSQRRLPSLILGSESN